MHFFGFSLFYAIFGFFMKNYQKHRSKIGLSRNFLNVLHSKFVKKTKGLLGLLSDPLI